MVVEIIQAIADKIKELYPSATIYDESVPQGFKDGSFFISVIDDSYSKSIANRFKGSVSFDLAYFPSNMNNLNNECFQVSQNVFRAFDLLSGFRITGKTSNVTDDVLHMQFVVKYREIKIETGTKMNDIRFK
jgi:hypothetical protein